MIMDWFDFVCGVVRYCASLCVLVHGFEFNQGAHWSVFHINVFRFHAVVVSMGRRASCSMPGSRRGLLYVGHLHPVMENASLIGAQ